VSPHNLNVAVHHLNVSVIPHDLTLIAPYMDPACRALMDSVGDKSKAAAHVAQELLFGAARNAGSKPDPDVTALAKMKKSNVRDHAFPVYRESEFRMREAVDLGAGIGDLEEVEPMPLKAGESL